MFLLPIQFSVLHIPSPAVTPTNLLFNIVATPGALTRYRRRAPLRSALTTLLLLAATVPRMIIAAVVRVRLIPGPRLFRAIVAASVPWNLAFPTPSPHQSTHQHPTSTKAVGMLAFGVGVIGGIYGIGGGSTYFTVERRGN